MAAVSDSSDHVGVGGFLLSSSGGVFFFCMMILMSFFVVSFVIFACGDSSSKTKGNTGNSSGTGGRNKNKNTSVETGTIGCDCFPTVADCLNCCPPGGGCGAAPPVQV